MFDFLNLFYFISFLVEIYLKEAKVRFNSRWNDPTAKRGRILDFGLKRTIDKFATGRLMLVEHETSKEKYAMKILDKIMVKAPFEPKIEKDDDASHYEIYHEDRLSFDEEEKYALEFENF